MKELTKDPYAKRVKYSSIIAAILLIGLVAFCIIQLIF